MKIQYKAQRALLSGAADQLLKYVKKDPVPRMLKLIDKGEGLMGDEFPAKAFQSARDIMENPDNMWHQFVLRLLEETDPGVLKKAGLAFGLGAGVQGTKTIRANREEHDCNFPWVILMDPTSACNLHCTGCWAAEYEKAQSLSYEEMEEIVRQGKELGTHLYMFTGGEPLIRKDDLIRLAKANDDCAFLIFTNATLIDQPFCDALKDVGNMALAISIEGFEADTDARRGEGIYQTIMEKMKLLKENGLLFGLSICNTRQNTDVVLSDDFLDQMIACGCRFAWYFTYMPVGKDAVPDMVLTVEQREYVLNRIRSLRKSESGKPIFLVDFQNDSEFVGGCIAGGRNYFHVNAAGDIEPCVFIHYSDSNIRTHSLMEALNRPLFQEFYHGQPFNDNLLRPCPMLENPEKLQGMVDETGAKSTDLLAPEDVHELCGKCENFAEHWGKRADEIWESSTHFQPKTQYARDKKKNAERS